MRRLPIFILLDTSGSMRGEPIEAVKTGLQAMIDSLRMDPMCLESAWLSLITFDRDAKVVVPLTELVQFQIPVIDIPQTSPTNLGEALDLLCECYDHEIHRSTLQEKGDWLPHLIIMTDGAPSDTMVYKQMINKLKSYRFAEIVACAAGPKARVEPLQKLTANVVILETMDSQSFSKFWTWVSVQIGRQSSTLPSPGIEIPEPPEEIKLVY